MCGGVMLDSLPQLLYSIVSMWLESKLRKNEELQLQLAALTGAVMLPSPPPPGSQRSVGGEVPTALASVRGPGTLPSTLHGRRSGLAQFQWC